MKILDQLKIYIIDLTKYTQNSTVTLNHHALIFLYGLKSILIKTPEFRRYRRDASHVSEYETLINSIFDIIYYEDENIHYALRNKLSNAWYQKKHREEKKVKKPNHYALTKELEKRCLCFQEWCVRRAIDRKDSSMKPMPKNAVQSMEKTYICKNNLSTSHTQSSPLYN